MKNYTANQEEKCKDIDPTLMYKELPAQMIVKDFIDGEESCNYEIYLRELINASSFFRSKSGGEGYLAPKSESDNMCLTPLHKYYCGNKFVKGSGTLSF